VRVALALLAIVASAWFALSIQQARDTARASAFITTHQSVTEREAAALDSLLSSAAALNPDETVDILRGRLVAERGDERQGEQLILRVTRDEPQNLDAWLSLAYSSPHNPPLFAFALGHLKLLDPLG
jgi:hypothetical protein